MANSKSLAVSDWEKSVEAATGHYDLFRLLKDIAANHNFSHFSVMRLPVDDENKLAQISIVTNWPPELIQEYDQLQLLQTNPIIKLLKSSNKPVLWDLDTIYHPQSSKTRSAVVELLSNFNCKKGIFIPCTAVDGTRGFVSFDGHNENQVTEEIIATLVFQASLVFDRLIGLSDKLDKQEAELSERELQCLHLMAAGSATGAIAFELDISEHTVNHHISVLCQKLRARNRAHAVSLAFRSKILR